MTIINPNSIAGITSVTAEAGVMNFYKSDGTLAGLQLNGVNFNTTSGISTFNNVYVGGTITYEDVKNVDSVGIITAREGIFLPDNKKVQLGNVAGTADFEIAHDTNNTVLQNRTGALYLKGIGGSGNNIIIEAKNNENSARFIPDGAVELYHNNSKKFETNAGGAQVHGNLIFHDNNQIYLGTSYDFRIYHNTHNYIAGVSAGQDTIFTTNNTERFRISSTGLVGIDKASGLSAKLHVGDSSNNNSQSQLIKLGNDSSGTGTGAQINMGAAHGNESTAACISGFLDSLNGTAFTVKTAGTYANQSTVAERFRITSAGKVGIGISTPDALLTLKASNPTIRFYDGSSLTGGIEGDTVQNTYYGYNGSDLVISTATGASYTERLRFGATGITTTQTGFNFPDGKQAIFGNSSDLQIWHDGSNSRVSDRGGAGNLQIETNNAILLQVNDSTNCMAKFFPTGNYQNEFYNDQNWTRPKLRTTDHGIDITHSADYGLQFSDAIGEIGNVAGFQAVNGAFTANKEFGIRATDIRFATGSSEKLRIDSSGRLLVGATATRTVWGGNAQLQVQGTSGETSSVAIIRNTADQWYPYLTFGKSRGTSDGSSTILQSGDITGVISFNGADGGDMNPQTAYIQSAVDGTPGVNDMPGRLQFFTTADGAYDSAERLRIDSSGRVIIGGTSHAGGGQLVVMGGAINSYGCFSIGNKTSNPSNGTTFANVRFNSGSGGTSRGAELYTQTAGNWSEGSSHPTNMIFATTASGGTGSTERLRLEAGGNVRVYEELQILRNTNSNSGFTKSGKVLHTPAYSEYQYTWSGQSSYTIDLTCASYFHSEFTYVQHQTNGGNFMQYYARGKWANNHTTHTGVMWEWHGDGGGLDVQFNVSDQSGNGNVNMRTNMSNNGTSYSGQVNGGGEVSGGSANGRLRISETYSWGSVAGRSLIVRVYYGSFSISKS